MKSILRMATIVTAGVMLITSLVLAAPTSAVNVTVYHNVPLEETGQTGRVAWEQGTIEALGTGMPPTNVINMAQGRALARRAAIVDAYRNLAEVIQGVQVDSETIMSNLAISSDVVKIQVSGLIKGGKLIREQAMPDGSYQVVMSIQLYGQDGLAGVALNAVKPESIQDFPVPNYNRPASNMPINIPDNHHHNNNMEYTGVIIDARGLGLESTFSPRLYDDSGRIVYGNMYIDTDFAISQGMVEYTITPQMAEDAENGQSRAGAHPLIIKALRVVDANSCNVVISNADANSMLTSNQNAGFLKKCAVVFER